VRRQRLRLLVVCLLAVGVRVLYLYTKTPDAPIASVDGWGYHRLALNLAAGNGFSLERDPPYLPTSIRTPLYPFFLLSVRHVLGPAPRAAALVQALLEGATTLLTAWLATRLAGPRGGRIAALLYALNPTQIRFTSDLLTEMLLAFLVLGAVCALVRYLTWQPGSHRRGWLLLSGTLLGSAILCKPNVQFLPLLWVFALALNAARIKANPDASLRAAWQRTLTDTLLLLAVVAVILAPWYVRNARTFGRPILSTAFEGNVGRVSAPAALAAARGTYAAPWSAEWEALFGEILTETAERYAWQVPWDMLTAREIEVHNRQLYRVAREVLLQHPAAWLRSHLLGMVRYLEPHTYRVIYGRLAGHPWPGDVLDDVLLHALRALSRGDLVQAGGLLVIQRWMRLDTAGRAVWWGTFLGQLIAICLALAGAWRLRHRPAEVGLLVLTVAYVLWVPGPIAYERFRVPVTSLILVLVAAAAPFTRAT
jgi:4-amino-4-deoxy-L-arabinose transferase-like glycosyltransferase